MIVEPTPTNPRSPLRRALRTVGMLLPVVLLVAIIGAGMLGPKVDQAALATLPPASVAAGTPSAPASPGASEVAGLAASFPTQFGDLAVEAPSEVGATRQAGGDRAALAVAGVLDVQPGIGCDDLSGGPLGPWCVRPGIIYDAATPTSGDTATFRPHLHVIVPIGVRLPDQVARAVEAGAAPVRVLVVGRFATVGCAGRCDDGFIVERFAWADGRQVGLVPLLADALSTDIKRPSPFMTSLDAADIPLMAVLTWPDGVSSIDPVAGRYAATGPPSEPVWYVRALDGARGPGLIRRIRWMLLSEKDLQLIASGRPSGMPAADAPAQASAPTQPPGPG